MMALHEIFHWNPHTRDAEWVGRKGTIPVCAAWLDSLADHRPGEVS